MSSNKEIRRCVPPCSRYIMRGDSHKFCIFCLGEEHIRSVLKGARCVHCERFPMSKLRSRLAFFMADETQACPPAEAGSEGPAVSSGSKVLNDGDKHIPTVKQQPHSHQSAYEELLEVVTRAVARLSLEWTQEDPHEKRSKLDGYFLASCQAQAAKTALPFFPDLHYELSRSWKAPFLAQLHNTTMSNYSYIMGRKEHGYGRMPKVEVALACHLSPETSSFLNTPVLPSSSSQLTSRLVGKAYEAAGQAGAVLHTMALLQAYQASLMKDFDTGDGLPPEVVLELRRATDMVLGATKETAHAIGCSMARMVTTERHLWLSLSSMKEAEKSFLLNTPISPSSLFGNTINDIVHMIQVTEQQLPALRQILPLHVEAPAALSSSRQPSPSSYREELKASVAARIPSTRRRGIRRSRQDLRAIIGS